MSVDDRTQTPKESHFLDGHQEHRTATNLVGLGLQCAIAFDQDGSGSIEQAISCFRQALLVLTSEEHPKDWAEANAHLGRALRIRASGEKGANIEEAIECLQNALTFTSEDSESARYVDIITALGRCYGAREKGSYQLNIGQALQCFRQALAALTTENDQKSVHLNMLIAIALTYCTGERSASLEEAISRLRYALSVMTYEENREDWLTCMEYLGYAFHSRSEGDRTQNLEEAVHGYQTVLNIMPLDQDAVHWASVVLSLTDALNELATPESTEECIYWSQQAFALYSETYPNRQTFHAKLQQNIGASLLQRSQGDRSQNVEEAIVLFKEALSVFTQSEHQIEWAKTMHLLGNALTSREVGIECENLELALVFFQSAFSVIRDQPHTLPWAELLIDIAFVYSARSDGDAAENSEEVIKCLSHALTVFTKEQNPMKYAYISATLGLALRSRQSGNPYSDMDKQVACYRQALSIITQEEDEQTWADLKRSLGDCLCRGKYADRLANIQEALRSFEQAEEVMSFASDPVEYGCIQISRGYALRQMANLLDDDSCAEDEICCYKRALECFPEGKNGIDSTRTYALSLLSSALSSLKKGDMACNTEEAIHLLRKAISSCPLGRKNIYLRDISTLYACRVFGNHDENMEASINALENALALTNTCDPEWVNLMTRLGLAIRQRDIKIFPRKLEDELECYRSVLSVKSRENDPEVWQTTKQILGHAMCQDTESEDAAKYLDEAVSCLKEALDSQTPGSENWLYLSFDLGVAQQKREALKPRPDFKDAISSLRNASLALVALRSGESMAQSQLFIEIQNRLIFLLLASGKITTAEEHASQAVNLLNAEPRFFNGSGQDAFGGLALDEISNLFGALVSTRLVRGDPWKALQWAEEGKCREVFSCAERPYNSNVSSLTLEDWDLYHETAAARSQLERILGVTPGGPEAGLDVTHLHERLRHCQVVLEDLERKSTASSSTEFALGELPSTASRWRIGRQVRELCTSLAPDVVLISLFYGPAQDRRKKQKEHCMHGFAICGGEIAFLSHKKLFDPMSSTTPLFDRTRVPVFQGPFLRAEEAVTHELLFPPNEQVEREYMELLGSFLEDLLNKLPGGLIRRRRIIISPHRGLHGVPLSVAKVGTATKCFRLRSSLARVAFRRDSAAHSQRVRPLSVLEAFSKEGVFVVPSLLQPQATEAER